MLDAGRAPEVIAGAIVFYDHADEGLRYVAAEAPRIDRRPDPMISLVLYRGLAEAGGLLQLESTLAPTEELLEAVQRELSKNGPAPRLAQPDWRDGEVEVAGWLDTEELAPLSLALGKPFLVGAPNVVLAARLDRAGAALAEAALRGDALPTALLWRLETLGLTGPLGVEVEADLRKMHDRLTAEGALTVPIGRARIAKTWEEFVTENLIRVEVVDESGDVESNRAEAVRRVGEELTAAMFLPAPPPEKPPLLENGTIAPIELSFRLTMRREELEQTRRWSFKERRAVPVVHYAAASLIGFLHGRSASDHILHVDLAQTPRREILVRSEPNLASIGLAAVETDLAFGEPEEPERTVALTDAAPESRFIVDHPLNAGLYWRARARFDPLKTSAEEAETKWFEANGDYVFVAASEAFPARRLTLLVGSAELSWIDHIEVRVSAPGEPERTVVLNQGRTIVYLQFPGAGEGPIRIAAQWNGLEGEPRLSAEPFETEEEMVILDSPFGPSINILAIPATSSETLNSTLELRYASPGFVDERTLHWESSDGDSRKAALRRPRGEASVYEYRTTVLDQSGQLAQSNWLRSTASVLIVDHRTMLTAHRARVLALGGGPAGRGSMAIELTLEAGERQTTAVMEGAEDLVELTLLSDENGPQPQLTSREFRNTGEVVETHWREIETVVLPLPATN